MNRNTFRWTILAALALAVAGNMLGAARADSFSSIHWAGAETNSEALQGKTVVLVSLVTWCPICNGWAPELLDQMKSAVADKPVVILAVATDVDATKAKSYMLEHHFTGPNILYGSDPTLSAEFGVDAKNLWNYVWFDPSGKVKSKGAIGSYFPGKDDAKNYAVPVMIKSTKHLGKLEFVSSTMSPEVKNFAWAIEMGDMSLLGQISSPRLQHSISKEDRDELLTMRTKFLDDQLSSAKKHFIGDVPEQIEAFQTATQLAAHFRATPQGKEAVTLAATLSNDPEFHKELGAQKLYNLALSKAGSDTDKRAKFLHIVSTRFPNTYYGDRAKQESEAAGGESPGKSSTHKGDSASK